MALRVDIDTLTREVKEIHEDFPKWTLDNAFIHWFLNAFLVADSELAARSVTGVSHDKGVDAVYLDEDSEKAFILQGKFHQGVRAPHEKRSDVLSFAQLARVLTGSQKEFRRYLQGIDPAVAERLEQVRQRVLTRNFTLHLYYVTTGKCSSPLKDEAKSEVAQANCRSEMSVVDRREVLTLLADYLSGAAPPVPYLDLKIDARGVTGSDGVIQRYDERTGIESWVLTMAGDQVGELYKKAGDRLFARNIRGFLENTEINEGMRQTLKHEPQHFWYFNNGITIVCDQARKTAERGQAILRVSNPQIINGQQTARQLHKFGGRDASVLVRVIAIPRDPSRDQQRFEQLVSSIVAATNWQNEIRPSDLRANDARQIALERDLAKFQYHYLRKRQTKREARRVLGKQHWLCIKKEELAQAVAACEFDPVVVRSGKEGLFRNPYYDRIFDGRPGLEYLTIYWIGRIVKYHASGYPHRAYAKWLVMHYLWSRVGRWLKPCRVADYFRRICERNQWSRPLDRAVREIYTAALHFYSKNRGKGAKAIDISTFFKRAGQHKRFAAYWRSARKSRRQRLNRFLQKFHAELTAGSAND